MASRATSLLSSLDHHDKGYAAPVPSANPHAPPVDAIAHVGRFEEAQELGLNFHIDSCMALFVGTVNSGC